MKFLSNWREVLTRAWSVRLTALAVFFTGAEAALPLLDGLLPVPQGVFAALSGLVGASALLARVVAQKDLPHE